MPRCAREQPADAIQHVTARCNHGSVLFADDHERQLFLQILWRTTREFDWACLSYCLMPNHFHLLLRHPRSNLSEGMQRLNLTYARRFNDRHDRYGHVFQGRFASRLVRQSSHLHATLRYIALNPVRAGMCSDAADFRWSAHRALLGIDPPRMVSVAETLTLFGTDRSQATAAYREHVEDRRADQEFAEVLDGADAGATPPDLLSLARTREPDDVIAIGRLELGYSFAAIGRALGRNRSSVTRRFAKLDASRATRGT